MDLYLVKEINKNICPDQYSPPNVNDIDWGRSNGQLADELSKAFGDDKKSQGIPNNQARKWSRDEKSNNDNGYRFLY